MSFDDAIEYLYGLQVHGIKLGLGNPTRLLAELGNPQQAFRCIHVAGTNGKGSTSAATASMLRAMGYKVGLFTSPHMLSFTERIRVDDQEISPEDVVSYADKVRAASQAAGLTPTFFEVVTAMGLLYFCNMGVDWAVIETGMGGRLDATNVIVPKVSVITQIDYDHTQHLGGSLREIAAEKAGIIKPRVPVVSAAQHDEAMQAVEAGAAAQHSPLSVEGREFRGVLKEHFKGGVRFDYISNDGLFISDLESPLAGSHQVRNMALAVRAIELSGGGRAEGCRSVECIAREGLAKLRWPGRLEIIKSDPLVILDGAHNPSATRALAAALAQDFLPGDGGQLALVFGAMADKDIEGMLRVLLPLAHSVFFVPPQGGRAAAATELAAAAYRLGRTGRMHTFQNVHEALQYAMKLGMPVLVTGSFYMLGEAREALGAKGFHRGLRE